MHMRLQSVVMSLFFLSAFGTTPPQAPQHKYHNSISKVFFHQGLLGDKLVCYFTGEPICNRWPIKDAVQQTGNTELVFFMPNTKLTSEAQEGLKRMASITKPFYRMQFEHVSQPMPGIKVMISYNPHKIAYEYEQFNPISAQHAIVFHLYNKDVLKDLKGKTDPLLRTASSVIKPKVMVDCGHGGTDAGTTIASHIAEKEVNLAIGKEVAQLLRSQGCSVILTRENDATIPVDQRTYLANRQNADLFISIHANSGNKTVSGIETYWAGKHLFKKQHSSLDAEGDQLIARFWQSKDAASRELARQVHTNSIVTAQTMHKALDRKVRESVAQVLLGTDMPAALIEVGFLSHATEGQLLCQNEYQKLLADGITKGITSYLKSRKML